jgi:hypothetical protein
VILLNTRLIKRCCALFEAKGHCSQPCQLQYSASLTEDMTDSQELDAEREDLYGCLLYTSKQRASMKSPQRPW